MRIKKTNSAGKKLQSYFFFDVLLLYVIVSRIFYERRHIFASTNIVKGRDISNHRFPQIVNQCYTFDLRSRLFIELAIH